MPFTIIDLRELMETFGKFERCWTNRTQTHCLVEVMPFHKFKSEESARKAATTLFHKEWPVGGRKLVTDYIDLKRMNELISKKRYRSLTSVPDDLNKRIAEVNGEPLPEKSKPSSLGTMCLEGLQIKTASEKQAERDAQANEVASGTKVAIQKSQEANQSELDRLFSKTQAKPQIYYRLLTHEEAMIKKRPPKVLTSSKKHD